MRHLAHHPLAAATLRSAATRASSQPADPLPCPVCAASVKGSNLQRHVTEKHADAFAHQRAGAPVLVGVDRRIRRWFWTVALVWLALEAATVVFDPDQLADSKLRSTEPLDAGDVAGALGDLATSPLGLTLLGGLVVLLVLVAAVRAHAFRATVTVADDGVRLRHRVGTGSIRVALPAAVETGQLYRRRPSGTSGSSGSGPTVDEAVGRYLRIGDGRRSIAVGCPHGTDLGKHWRDVASGARRKHWDVTLAPGPFVALQYALADRGALRPR